jgi:formate-dependent nitrite reductase cytochrome c552 subunit
MAPYVESLENPDVMGFSHAAEGLVCMDCHDGDSLEALHETVVPVNRIEQLTFSNEFCFGCHLENEHTSYEQVAERTTGYMINDELHNPHDPHANAESEQSPINCASCHQMHKEWLLWLLS